MTIQNIVDFITYVAPGFIASEIYYSHFPVKQRTPLTQLAQSIIGGLVIVSFLRWIDQAVLAGTLHTNTAGVPDIRFSGALIGGGVAAGYLAVVQLSFRSVLASRYARLAWLSSGPDSIWQYVNRPSIADWAAIYLHDGSIYLGWISRYRFDPDAQDQDFLLTHASRVTDRLKIVHPVDGIGVYLNTRDVSRIEFLAPPKPRQPPRKKKGKRAA